jgi:hypothetical protein
MPPPSIFALFYSKLLVTIFGYNTDCRYRAPPELPEFCKKKELNTLIFDG